MRTDPLFYIDPFPFLNNGKVIFIERNEENVMQKQLKFQSPIWQKNHEQKKIHVTTATPE